MKKMPIWELLIERGLFDDKKTAQSWIMMGKVFANGRRIDKLGQMVSKTDVINIKDINQKYVGKGGLKLEGALKAFNMDITGIVAIDAGASTGGFTDCLIQHGAKRVYAVDVGYGQLAGRLSIDKRVISLERTNISDVDPEKLDPAPTLATVDLSYLSLKKAIPIFANILKGKGEMLCLVKPLFEVNDSNARRTGVIEDPKLYKEVLMGLVCFADQLDYHVIGVAHSPVTGNKGTREFFIRIALDQGIISQNMLTGEQLDAQINMAVVSALQLEPYKTDDKQIG